MRINRGLSPEAESWCHPRSTVSFRLTAVGGIGTGKETGREALRGGDQASASRLGSEYFLINR